VAAVSHEVRTPSADHGDAPISDAVAHDLNVVDAEVRRLQRLVDDLFALARADVHELDFQPELLNAASLSGLKERRWYLSPGNWPWRRCANQIS